MYNNKKMKLGFDETGERSKDGNHVELIFVGIGEEKNTYLPGTTDTGRWRTYYVNRLYRWSGQHSPNFLGLCH